MAVALNGLQRSLSNSDPIPDHISAVLDRSWDDLFGLSMAEREEFQLAAARERFETLAPQIRVLQAQADTAGLSRIDDLDDLVPLLFNHTAYKSYPMSLIEHGRFDLMTRWLDGLTSIDLSHVEAGHCDGIDAWLDALEAQTPLRPNHTSGTKGKLSYIPRTGMEIDFFNRGSLKTFEGFHDEPGVALGDDGLRLPVIYPSLRHGRYVAQRSVAYYAAHIAPSPEQCYTLTNGTLSADLMSLSGRIRVAQSKGELGQMKLTDAMRVALKRYLEELERRPEEMAAFFARMTEELRGQRVFLMSQTGYLVQAAERGRAQGLRQVFSPDSVSLIGGGGKGVVLPDDWLEIISDFSGISIWRQTYAMTEICGAMPLCGHDHFHIPLYHVAFLLDPETGAVLPREGTRTGRFGAFDLLAQTYWGGVVSGDKVTITWDGQCPCGRTGPYVHNDVTRYDESVTGDDKITCSATIDNTDEALQQLLDV
jgi:hypothetical protein